MAKRNAYLTEGMAQVLRMIDESEDKELAWEQGGGWWVGDTEVSPTICNALLRLCLLREEDFCRESFKRYTINGDGKKAMEDPAFVPPIIAQLRGDKL